MLQPDSSTRQVSAAFVGDMFRGGYLQNSGNFRMYVEYPALDDAEARLHRILSHASHYYIGQYASVRPLFGVSDVLFPLELHALVYCRNHGSRFAGTAYLHPPFPHHQEVSAIRHRLVGCSALVCFFIGSGVFFNYADWYDWWNSPVICRLAVVIVLTLTVCVGRMCSIRHPFFEPKMWTYRHLIPVLLLITVVEGLLATEHVLEEVFYSDVMRYEETVSVQLDWMMLIGVIGGCLFAYWWMHVKRFNYLRLIIVGIAGIGCYLMGYYFTVSSDIHLSQLYLPTLCRGFAYAILSATFMTCLEEIMTFQHFFQALSVFNMLHMIVGGVMGAALYTRGLSYYVSDNISRYGAAINHTSLGKNAFISGDYIERFISQMMEISVKQIYGWAIYGCILLFLLFLLYDAPIRRELKQIPGWRSLRKEIAETFSKPRQR